MAKCLICRLLDGGIAEINSMLPPILTGIPLAKNLLFRYRTSLRISAG